MSKRKHKSNKRKVSNSRGFPWRIVGLIATVAVFIMGYWIWHQYYHAVDPGILAGQWVRPDGGYVLQLSDTGPDGKLKAEYFNPQPIHVARVEWNEQDGLLGVFIELRDVNYPGSTYKLAYDSDNDRLRGIYFQAVIQQQFDVEFDRMK